MKRYDVHPPASGPICDFCSGKEVYARYPAKTFNAVKAGEGQRTLYVNSEDDWAACQPCAALIDAGSWDGLLQRSVQTFREKYGSMVPEKALREFISDLHCQFRSNRQHTH